MKKIILLLFVLIGIQQYSKAQCTSANGGFILASSTAYCGSPVTLTVINPQLQGNTQWVWYAGSCGGTQVGTGVSISVSPTAETTYYVRGEGGCATSACRAPIVITVPALGTITSVSTGVERCGLGTVTLTAQADQGTINWYRTPTETTVRGTGTSFTAGAQNFGVNTFYAEVTNGGCVTLPRTAVSFNAKDLPAAGLSSIATCPGGSATVTVTPNANSTFNGWYDAPTGGNFLSSALSYVTPALNTTTSFYGRLTHATNGCTATVTATPNIRSVPVLSSVTDGERCGPGSVSVSANYTVTGTTIAQYLWYDALTGGNLLSTQQNFATPSISNTTTYYVTAMTVQGCENPTRQPVVATVKSVPTISATTPASRCGDGTVSLSATGSAGTLQWFNAETGGTQVGTGTSYTTPSLTVNTPYFVQATNNGCTSGRTSVMATIKPIPTLSAFAGAACDAGPITLGATSNGTISWFAAASGGSALTTGESYTTPAITSTTVYYVEATLNGCTTPTRSSATAVIRTTPTILSVSGDTRCGEGSVTISAVPSAGAVRWYNAPTGGNQLSSDLSFTTNLATTTTYYVAAINQNCESGRTAVVTTIKPLPTLTTTGAARCDAGTVTLSAVSNGTVNWYAAATGGSSIGTGNNFTTPSISTTTNYFGEAVLDGCTSLARVQATATVNTSPAQPTISQDNSNIEAPVLTSSAPSGNQWFKNDVEIAGQQGVTHTVTSAGIYKVRVTLNGCTSPFSANATYIVTGVENLSEAITLFPNPTADELIIDLAGFTRNEMVAISLFDFLGRSMQQTEGRGGEQIRIDVKPFHPGQYVLVMKQGKVRATKSFIKSF